MKRLIPSRTVLLLLLSIHLSPAANAASLKQVFLYNSHSGNTLQLSNPTRDSLRPDVNDMGHVAWEEDDGNDWEIFLYQGGFPVTQITNNTRDDELARINNQDFLSWQQYDGMDREIVFYDGTTATVLTNNDTDDEAHQLNDNGMLVWHASDGTDHEIYYYDGTVHKLTNNGKTFDDNYPQINVHGHIVWEGWMGITPLVPQEIFLFNGTNTKRITTNANSDIEAQISDGGIVVWERTMVPNSHIFQYDGTSVTQISTTMSNGAPKISSSGAVTWMGDDGKDAEIFLYKGGTVHQITNNDYDDWFPEINDNDQLAWMGRRGGQDWEIFYYDGTSTTQITNNSYDDDFPQIANCDNNGAYIAWDATVKPCGTLPATHGSPAVSLSCFLLFAIPPLGWLHFQKRRMRGLRTASA